MRISKRLINWKYSYLYLISIIGLLIFFFVGTETLSCQRINSGEIDCKLFNSQAGGLLGQEPVQVNDLKNVQIEEKIKETIEADQAGKIIKKDSIYSVVLEFDEGKEMVFQGYGYQLQPKQLLAEKIQEFLQDSEQINLMLQENRFWPSIVALALMILPIAFILKTEFFSASQ